MLTLSFSLFSFNGGDFSRRLVSAVVLGTLVLGVIWAGPVALAVLIALLAPIMAIEWIALWAQEADPAHSRGNVVLDAQGPESPKGEKFFNALLLEPGLFNANLFDCPARVLLVTIGLGVFLLIPGWVMGAMMVAVMGVPLIVFSAPGWSVGRGWWLASGAVYILLPCAAVIWIGSQPQIGMAFLLWGFGGRVGG